MNWLDIVLIVFLAAGALIAMRTGLIGAAITAAGVVIGWQLAGRWADDLGGVLGDSLSVDTWATVVAYVVIIALAVVAAGFVGKFVRPLITVATLGLAGLPDKLGGLGLGLLIGIAMSGAVIIVLARLTYDFEVPEEGIAGSLADRIPRVEETRARIEDALTASAIVPVFVDITDALPASALGFVPEDFKASLDILDQKLD